MLRSHPTKTPKDIGETGQGVLLLRSHSLTLLLNAKWEWRYVVVDTSKAGLLLCRTEGDYRRGLIGRVIQFHSIESVDMVMDIPELKRKSNGSQVPQRFRVLATNSVRQSSNWIFEAQSPESAQAWVKVIRNSATLQVNVYRNLEYTDNEYGGGGTLDRGKVLYPEQWVGQSETTRSELLSGNAISKPRYANAAICLSGGGMRSLVSVVGQLRALKNMGLLDSDHIGYISSVSGGAWASSVYTYFQEGCGAEDDSDLLGAPMEPGFDDVDNLNLIRLGDDPPPLARVARTKFTPLARKFVLNTRPSHLYERIVGEAILSPFGLSDGIPFATCETEEPIRNSNPTLSELPMHVPSNDKRPFWIANGVILVPRRKHQASHPHSIAHSLSRTFSVSESPGLPHDGVQEDHSVESAPRELIPIQFSSLFSGNPVLYEISPECDVENCAQGTLVRVGGSMIDTFGFGTREPATGNDIGPTGTRKMQKPSQGAIWSVAEGVTRAVRGLLSWSEEAVQNPSDVTSPSTGVKSNRLSMASVSSSLRRSKRKSESNRQSTSSKQSNSEDKSSEIRKSTGKLAALRNRLSNRKSQKNNTNQVEEETMQLLGESESLESNDLVEIVGGFEVSKARVPYPRHFFSLKRAIGISSHVVALSLHGSGLGKAFIPKTSVWNHQLEQRGDSHSSQGQSASSSSNFSQDMMQESNTIREESPAQLLVDSGDGRAALQGTPSLMRSQTQAFTEAVNVDVADGGFVDIFGLFPVLQRSISRCIVFVNTAHPLPRDHDADFATWTIPELTSLFGECKQKISEERRHYFRNNQVFEHESLRELLNGLQDARDNGKPVMLRQQLKVRENKFVGCRGGWTLDVIWFYLSRSEGFVEQLPLDTRKELNKPTVGVGGADGAKTSTPEFYPTGEPIGKFNLFPQYKTTGQNKGGDVSYTSEQINLLTRFTEWTVRESAAEVRSLLEPVAAASTV